MTAMARGKSGLAMHTSRLSLSSNDPFLNRGSSSEVPFSRTTRQAAKLDENRIVLYKKGKALGQGYYLIEISSNNVFLFIVAQDIESQQSFLIELDEKRAKQILKQFENNYD